MKKPTLSHEASASAVLPNPSLPADKPDRLHPQQFVVRSTLPAPAAMTTATTQSPSPDPADVDPQPAPGDSIPAAWQDSTGEGAASALESLRRLERSRHHAETPGEHPAQ